MTKRLKLAVFLLFGLAAALGAQEKLASRVARVTVFADRALVTRRAEVSLFRGETVFLVTDLPAEVDPASVQISGAGAFTLRDVRVSAHQKTRDVSEQLRSLENEKRALEDQAAAVNDRIREAEAERGFLAEIAKRLTVHVGPSEALPLDPAAWTGMLDFHRLRNAAVNETVRVSRREVQGLQAEIDRVSREISGLGSVSRLSVTEVVLVVDAPAPIKAVLEISYLVTGPSWRPNYVLRAAFASSRVAVHYRALVRQNTGEGWEGAVLSLSTARPQAGGSVPILPPWHLDIPRAVPVLQRADVKETLASPAARGTVLGESLADQEQAAPAMRIDSALASAGATA
ncbi:MAG TPA: mucoidy inhibitor MuiA family protein, partial [Magnetospirillaceae bacterium]|nr:mucoidy inhibitor MuiA family protein [Magnetospirillaceae bacterium]